MGDGETVGDGEQPDVPMSFIKETKPENAEASRQVFIMGRKSIANDVRDSVCEWKRESQSNHSAALMQAYTVMWCTTAAAFVLSYRHETCAGKWTPR